MMCTIKSLIKRQNGSFCFWKTADNLCCFAFVQQLKVAANITANNVFLSVKQNVIFFQSLL